MDKTVKEGLRDVVVANSSICIIDGQMGKLRYRGVDIDELARHSTYEETAYLLWFGDLPDREQLEEIEDRLVAHRELGESIRNVIKALPNTLHPMEVLRTIVSALPGCDVQAGDTGSSATIDKAIRLTAKLPTIVAYSHRCLEGREFVSPNPALSHAANFLYMLRGQVPTLLEAETMNLAMILMAEHDLNASTFAGRVTASTLSDMYSAITTAVGTLKGPLHGGASQWTMEMMLAIGTLENVEPYIKGELAAGRRIPGFGHRVYRKVADPRSVCFREKLKELCTAAGDMHWYNMAVRIAEVVYETSGLYPNVDYFGGPVLYSLGIPLNLFTPVFAISRIAGWIAHMIEQYDDNQLLRPLSNYVGIREKEYVALEARNGESMLVSA